MDSNTLLVVGGFGAVIFLFVVLVASKQRSGRSNWTRCAA
jgi:hypothetical protein